MLADNPNYAQRIAGGKRVEAQILNGFRKLGFKIDNPTAEEDKYDKIDGWWHGKKGKRYPVQIKFRQSGDDILFELIKDIDRKIEGRDVISKADVYLVADRQGTTRMYLTKPIKEQAKKMIALAEKDMAEDPFKTRWRGTGWEMKLQIDRAHGQRKLVAYFEPTLFNALGTWRLHFS